ncbi:GAF and ANTAR domain-containing protein [Kibdelosporangium aridum]|uniref:GAF and ANTAR domain-containing protein n=1 Tax=Kibdelosporangium aridum TaxID=2030 RepID=UPI000559DE33|nr:GAF and ANTAR domain-containing protein [Kibdelosporangium aridum]
MVTNEAAWAADRAAFHAEQDLPSGSPLSEQFTDLTRNLLDATSVRGVLEQVATAALRVVPGVDLVSLTLRSPDGSFHTPVHTDPVAVALDQVQYETGEGPCLDAALSPGPAQARSDDLAVESAWPHFGPAAAAYGVRAVLSVALLPNARPPQHSGALNLYSRRAGALRADAHEPALLLATHASLALAGTAAVTHAEITAANMLKAIDSRDVIGQAKGILMARRGITAEKAFDELRRASQNLNIKLTEVARILATHHTELELSDSPTAGA